MDMDTGQHDSDELYVATEQGRSTVDIDQDEEAFCHSSLTEEPANPNDESTMLEKVPTVLHYPPPEPPPYTATSEFGTSWNGPPQYNPSSHTFPPGVQPSQNQQQYPIPVPLPVPYVHQNPYAAAPHNYGYYHQAPNYYQQAPPTGPPTSPPTGPPTAPPTVPDPSVRALGTRPPLGRGRGLFMETAPYPQWPGGYPTYGPPPSGYGRGMPNEWAPSSREATMPGLDPSREESPQRASESGPSGYASTVQYDAETGSEEHRRFTEQPIVDDVPMRYEDSSKNRQDPDPDELIAIKTVVQSNLDGKPMSDVKHHQVQAHTQMNQYQETTAIMEDSTDADNRLLVHGILGISRDALELFFESSRRCCGGEIEEITINEEEDTALITYQHSGFAARVIERGPTFVLASQTLTVERPPKPDPCSILVRGICHNTSRDTLSMFFESKKRSAGGDIVTVEYEEGRGDAIVTFQDVDVAQRVLAQKLLKLEDVELTVTPAPVSYDYTMDGPKGQSNNAEFGPNPKVVLVHGIGQDMKKDTLELYLESEKHGGGEIESLDIDAESGQAIVKYLHSKDAQRILQIGQLTISGTSVSLHPEETVQQPRGQPRGHKQMFKTNHSSSLQSTFPTGRVPTADELSGVNTIQIVDIPRISQQHLRLELENVCRGKVLDVTIYQEDRTAVIKFKLQIDVVRLLQKGVIHLEGSACHIIPLDTSVNDQSAGSQAILVSGLNNNISDKLLDMYFNNRRKSGGYDVMIPIFMCPNEGKAVITFESPDAVKSVLGMNCKSPLTLKNIPLQVEELEPLPPPPLIIGPIEPHKLMMVGAPSVIKNELELFLSGSCNYSEDHEALEGVTPSVVIKRLSYSFQHRVILIEFPSMPDYNAMQLICVSRPLKDTMVSLQKVAITTMIQVKNIANLDTEELELYFESRRAGGADIKGGVRLQHDGKCAVIDYGDVSVVKAVLQKSTTHVIEKQAIEVEAYYPAFGVSPPGHDPSKPWDTLPEPFVFALSDPYILKFLLAQAEAIGLFTDVGRTKGFCVDLDKSDDSGLYICASPDDSRKIADVDKWEQVCGAELEVLCDTILIKRINTVAECFQDIKQAASNLIPHDSVVLQEVDEEHSIMVFVGWEPEVKPIVEDLEKVISQIEDHLTRQSQAVEDKIPLKPYQVILIRAKRYEDDFHHNFPRLDVKLSATSLVFKGLPDEVKSAKLHLYENITLKIKSNRWHVSQQRLKLSQKKEVRSFVISEFNKVKPKVVMAWEASGSELVLHTMSDRELNLGQTIMQAAIVETTIHLQTENIPVLQCQAWTVLKQKLRSDHGDVFLLEENVTQQSINVAVTSNICDGFLEDIRNCLDDHSVLEEAVSLASPVLNLLSEYHEGEIKAIANSFKQCMVTISVSETGCLVKGTKYGLPPALKQLQDLCGKVVSGDHEINRPGMGHFFHSNKGINAVNVIQKKHMAVCVDPMTIMKPIASKHSSVSSIFSTDTKELSSYSISGVTVRVLMGDITKHKVDTIVNAANGKLMHAGGLAAAIVKAGGYSIQDECNKYMKHRSDLLPGHVYTSASGNLPCKLIVHAVGPKWTGGKSGEKNELYEAISNSLEATDRAQFRSIAIPVISSGIYGFPISEATKVICEAVFDYFTNNTQSSIQEVHLMDNRDKGATGFEKSMETCLRKSGNGAAQKSGSTPQQQPLSVGQKIIQYITGTSKYSPVTAGTNADIIQTSEGISITIKRGSIPDQQVDVIVNTTSNNLQLNSGGVSLALYQKAGTGIQQECDNNVPTSFHSGDIVVTSGGNLPGVSYIFHGHCGGWDGGKHLKKFVSNALKEAGGRQSTSIAFPAIGTGNLKYPCDQVAAQMVDEIVKFSAKNPNTTVRDVRVVLFPQDTPTIQAFEDHWKAVILPQGGTRPKTRKMEKKSASDSGKNAINSAVQGKYYVIREDSDKFIGKIGPMEITVMRGDITKESVDAIVNSTNQVFDQQGAVSKAIAKAGGDTIAEECKKILDSNHGRFHDVAITGAGTLPAKSVVHINATHASGDWESLLFKALRLANDNGLKSLAMPAVGTGSLQNSHEAMANIILKAITRFTVEQKPNNLHTVRIVIYDKPVFTAFKKHMLTEFKGKGSGLIATLLRVFGINSDESPVSAPSMVSFRIFAMDQARIDNVKRELDELCKDEIKKHVFGDPEEQKLISKLTADHITEIKTLEGNYQVKINIEQGVRINRIIVEGCCEDMMRCIADISKLINNIKIEDEQENLADLIFQQVRWQYKDGQKFVDYPVDINYAIEKAYAKKEKTVDWREEDGSVQIDFKKMMEKQSNTAAKDVAVQRKLIGVSDSTNVKLPITWSPMQAGQTSVLVQLTNPDAEYQQVAQSFASSGLPIKKIERVQNPNLYYLYMLRKSQMDATNVGIQNEKKMYHGTGAPSVVNINQGGFNRSYCGKNATVYGDGVYFALAAQYSARPTYSPPDSQGNRHMYQARVLVGQTCGGAQGYKEPPFINGSSGKRYDSVGDGSGGIVVIFNDSQAYPEYLITF